MSLQQTPIASAESRMNKQAGTADVEARIAIAKAQLSGLTEDSPYIKQLQKTRIEEVNKAYNILIEELQKQLKLGQGDTVKIWLDIKELQAKQLENQVSIKKLLENRVSFNLPDGLRLMTYNEYLQSTASERVVSAQSKNVNINIHFGGVTVRRDEDIREIVRGINNAITTSFRNGIRVR